MAKKKRVRYYGMTKIRPGLKVAWLTVENKHGWALGLALSSHTLWLRNVRFPSLAEVKKFLRSGNLVAVALKGE